MKDSPVLSSPEIPAHWLDLFTLIPGYDPVATALEGDRFDATFADNAVRFFHKYLTHVEGELAGKPFDLRPWQQAIVGCAFGWKRADGTRRYREVFQFVPRKNGKSTMLGGLINLVAFCDHEPGAQLYSAAAEREQAALVHRQAKGMILANAELSRGTRIYATFKSIEYPTGSVYKALSADADTKHGLNVHFACIDELHNQPNRELVEVLMTGTGARRQPLIWHITTADYDRESICNEKYDYACKVRDGVIQESSFLPVIFEAGEDDDWTSEAVWAKANPNLGVSVSLDYLQRECKRAQEVPAYENTFKRLHLNMRTQQDVRWLSLEQWDLCAGLNEGETPAEWLKRKEAECEKRECYAAVDLSSISDVTAMLRVFRDDDGGYTILPRFWLPEETAKVRDRKDRVPYLTWAREGFIRFTTGNRIDYRFIRQEINELSNIQTIKEVAFDPWNAQQLATQLGEEDGFEMVEFRQGTISMNEPCKELERLIGAKLIRHGGNPVLRWMVSNVCVKIDESNNLRPDKKRSTEKIDGVVALIMAIGRAMIAITETSAYETRGIKLIG
jgi:phage terminase large subunit-like protein